MLEIARQEDAGGRRVGNCPLTAGLSCLRSDAHHAMCGIDIVGAKRAQLFAPKGSVVGKREHQSVPNGLCTKLLQNVEPLLF